MLKLALFLGEEFAYLSLRLKGERLGIRFQSSRVARKFVGEGWVFRFLGEFGRLGLAVDVENRSDEGPGFRIFSLRVDRRQSTE